MIDLHRKHLGAAGRRTTLEVSHVQGVRATSSACLSRHLIASQTTASQAAMRTEATSQLEAALEQVRPMDREILTLRHFEELSNDDTAAILGVSKKAASNRYVRALRRLHRILDRGELAES